MAQASQNLPDRASESLHTWFGAVLVPLATVGLYSYSFFFEIGYANYFSYPREFIPITLSLILNVWVLILVYLFWSVGFLQLNLQYWPHRGKIKYAFIAIFIIWMGLLIATKTMPRIYFHLVLLLGPVIAICGDYFMRRATRQKTIVEGDKQPDVTQTQNELDDIPMIYDSRSKVPSYSIAYRMVLSLGFDPVLILILVLMVIPAMFWSAGFSEAMSKKEFFTFTRSETEYLVLRIFDERLITVPFNRKSCDYTEEFSVAVLTDVVGLKPVRLECLRRPIWKALR